jgi:hypothetical protein
MIGLENLVQYLYKENYTFGDSNIPPNYTRDDLLELDANYINL